MDGLIKGLIDVTLGHDDRNEQSGPSSDRDDTRSRSSWAQVVSGDADDDDDNTSGRHDRRSKRASQESPRADEENNDGRKTVQIMPTRQSHKDEKNDDGWQTVQNNKPSRRESHKVHKEQWGGYKRPAAEQDYSSEVDCGVRTEPSEEELADLSAALNQMWELDLNRSLPGKDYEIDCGEGKKVYQKEDMAETSLFSWLNEDIFRRPTYSRFSSLLDNYNPHEGYKEVVTTQERQEQTAFIEEISRTKPIKYLYKYLLAKGIASESYQDFKRMLTSIWFDLYGRAGTSSCSSAFEHVFVGEIKRGEQQVSGFHNWIQFYLEEAKGRVDYQGYIFPRRRGQVPDSETQLLTIQFEWNGVLKSVSSTLIGVSPEFEIAMYTLCFYVGGEDNHVQIGPYSINIKCYRLGNKIGSAFPVADS